MNLFLAEYQDRAPSAEKLSAITQIAKVYELSDRARLIQSLEENAQNLSSYLDLAGEGDNLRVLVSYSGSTVPTTVITVRSFGVCSKPAVNEWQGGF